ncbi:MAG: potassium-transporting ATPase subunit KdpC [Burkholderiaceae bacterium]|nr:potassium-transporting ATPase subunit KdpC [Microbacteriaceae bacterium]
MSIPRGTTRPYLVAIRAMLVLTVLVGVGYPLLVTGAALLLPAQANGSLLSRDGQVVGSSLIGQSFTDADGAALPEWFQSRPSTTGYDGGASSGSNLGPNSSDLTAAIAERRAAITALDGATAIPADALTASGSGLDPQISPDYALLQVPRVSAARGLDEQQLRALVASMIQGRDLGFLGEETVNVLRLNLAVAALGTN